MTMTTARPVQHTSRVADWIRINARNTPTRNCFVTDDRAYTFQEVNSRVNRVASALVRRGVEPGDRVGLFATDSTMYLETIMACLKIGAVYVPLNYRLSGPEVQLLLRTAEARVLFYSDRYSGLVDGLDVPTLDAAICFEADGVFGRHPDNFQALLDEGVDLEIDVPVSDDEMICLAFTSGTTGLPKGVMHSQRMVKFMTYQCIFDRRMAAPSFHYSPSPLFHVGGLLWAMAGICRGWPSLILPAFEAPTVLKWLQRGDLNGVFLVPTMIDMLLELPGVRDSDYSNLTSIAYGAAPMSPSLLRRAMDVFHCDFMNMFGAGTEAGLQTVLTPEDHRRALNGEEHLLGSIGKAGQGVDLRLCDDDLNDVAPGEVGEIVTRSDCVMLGYLNQPEATSRVIVDGWFRGGDLARADAEGYLYLSGRRNDMIIRGGENIYPLEIEDVLSTIPGIREVAVVGVPDDRWGEIVRAHVILQNGGDFDEAAVRQKLRERLAGYKVPERFSIDSEFPRNASGKVLKRVLRERPQ